LVQFGLDVSAELLGCRDDQVQVLAAPLLFFFFVGYLSSTKLGFAACTAVGIFLSRSVARLKADRHPAFAVHWLYWHLPASPLTAMRATPPSHIRRMVG
jgi:conjugal transfer pilus assembly protein TraL